MLTYEEVNDHHINFHHSLEFLDGGEQRTKRGKYVEELIKDIFESLDPSASATVHFRTKYYWEEFDIEEKVNMDVVLYKNGTPLCVVECKAYLDKTGLNRAVLDFLYTQDVPEIENTKKIIVALETNVNKDMERLRIKQTVLDDVFYLCDGVRSSARPMYKKEFLKPINPEKYDRLVTFFKQLLNNS